MRSRTGPRNGRGRARARIAISLLVGAILATLVALQPTTPAAAGGQSAKGTLGEGYFFVATDGGIFNYGDSDFFGSTGDLTLNQPIVGAETTPTGEGYYLVAADGGIFTFGDAEFFGSTGAIKLNKPIVDMAVTPTGKGYWLVATDGGIFTFGDAGFYGSEGATKLVQPVVGMDATSSGLGYYMVASDGGIFTHGDAKFLGSEGGTKLNKPIVGMATLPDAEGYYLVATDGGIFTHGDAEFLGSRGGSPLNQPVVGMDVASSGQGYYLVAADGGIFSYGAAPFFGSRGGQPLNKPIVGMTVTPNSPLSAPDFIANLRGSAETTGGDTDGKGFAYLDFSDDELCYNLKVNNIDQATAAHIHEGPAGVAGPIVVTLKVPDNNGTASACMDLDKDLIKGILANPQGYYVNVHNAAFPDGAARGQLKGHTGVALAAPDAETPTKAKVVVFDTENPGSATVIRTVETGGAPVLGADFRPGTTDAFFLLQSSATTGVLVKSTLAGETTTIASVTFGAASAFGFDFNPVADRIRVVTNTGENFRLDPDTGAKTGDTTLAYAAGDPGVAGGGTPVAGAAYTNNFAGATSTTLFDVDYVRNTFVMQGGADGTPSPNGGVLTTVGALGFDISLNFGLDISKAPAGELGTTLIAGQPQTPATGVGSVLLALDRASGKATNIGTIGSDDSVKILAFSILS